uniref:Uncharacterized protein n=1 Tax=Glossina pallidipes TaxID=7398 RepID=A0A1B0A2M3_GLOPL
MPIKLICDDDGAFVAVVVAVFAQLLACLQEHYYNVCSSVFNKNLTLVVAECYTSTEAIITVVLSI